MSGNLFLDWAVLSVSIFNTILLLWLGLTVLLNAERRHAGIWLAGGGLLIGAVFFLSHTAILGFGLYSPAAGNVWWRIGWVPVILSPFAWYVVMLWYAGFWEGRGNPVARRHRKWLALLSAGLALLVGLAVFASLLPSFTQVARLETAPPASLAAGRPVLLLYSFFIIACIGLTLDALRRPGPTLRMMGGLARRRARPWLVAATFALLAVSLLVGGFLWWAAFLPWGRHSYWGLATLVTGLDLLVSGLIGAAVLLTGQAVAAYEIFTGKSLPRRGLQRYWRRAVILAAGYGSLAGLSQVLALPAIYALLLGMLVMVVFYALLGWRSYSERQRMLQELRPFVAGPGLFGRLLAGSQHVEHQQAGDQQIPDEGEATSSGSQAAFDALCQQVLNTSLAVLRPEGPMAPLFGEALVYTYLASTRPGEAMPYPQISGLTPKVLCVPVGDGLPGGLSWAVPLWNERGLCGVLLLGDKLDEAPYTEEEIEVARAACERLVDLQAAAEMARRLMALQRRQLAESQVLDRQTRRVIHDEVLPRLHATLLALGSSPLPAAGQDSETPQEALMAVHRQLSALLRDLPAATTPEVARLGLAEALRRTASEEYGRAFESVDWQVALGSEAHLHHLPALKAETAYYAAREAVRNAARHARPAGDAALRLQVRLACDAQRLEICVQDNGAGMPGGEIAPDQPVAEQAVGSADKTGGHGLALHSTLLAVLGGSLVVEHRPGQATIVRINLPVNEQ